MLHDPLRRELRKVAGAGVLSELKLRRALIGNHGDAVIVRTIEITAGEIPVPAVWTRASVSSPDRLRDAVHVEARFVDESAEPATKVVTGTVWDNDRTLRIMLYLGEDLEPGATAKIQLRISWPRYASTVLDGTVEKEHWVFRRSVGSFSVKTVFTSEFAPYGVKVIKLASSPRPEQAQNKTDGSTVISFAVPTIQQDVDYGYRYEVIRRS